MSTTPQQIGELLALLGGRDVRRLKWGEVELEFGPPAPPPITKKGLSAAVEEAVRRPQRSVYEEPLLYTDKPGPYPDEIVPSFPLVDLSSTAPVSEREETSD